MQAKKKGRLFKFVTSVHGVQRLIPRRARDHSKRFAPILACEKLILALLYICRTCSCEWDANTVYAMSILKKRRKRRKGKKPTLGAGSWTILYFPLTSITRVTHTCFSHKCMIMSFIEYHIYILQHRVEDIICIRRTYSILCTPFLIYKWKENKSDLQIFAGSWFAPPIL